MQLQSMLQLHYALSIFNRMMNTHVKKILLLGIACFTVFSTNVQLSAQSPYEIDETIENVITAPTTDEQDHIKMLTENVCDLLLRGYSSDEIIAIFSKDQDNKENLSNIQTLLSKVNGLLNQQHSKEEIINIIVSNDTDNSFTNKIKNLHLTLKIALTTGIILGLSYAAYELYKWYHKKNSWDLFPHLGQNNTNQEPNDNAQPNDNNAQKPPNNQPKQPHDQHKQQPDNIQPPPARPINELAGNAHPRIARIGPVQENQEAHVPNGVGVQLQHINDVGAQPQHVNGGGVQQNQAWRILGAHAFPDNRLNEAIEQQVAHANNIGLKPAADIPDFVNRPPRDNLKFNELIAAQIEYARGIGLIPAQLDNL